MFRGVYPPGDIHIIYCPEGGRYLNLLGENGGGERKPGDLQNYVYHFSALYGILLHIPIQNWRTAR